MKITLEGSSIPNINEAAWIGDDPMMKGHLPENRVVHFDVHSFLDKNAKQTIRLDLKEYGVSIATFSVNIVIPKGVTSKIKDDLYLIPANKNLGGQESEEDYLKRVGLIEATPICSIPSGFNTYRLYRISEMFQDSFKQRNDITLT